MPSNRTVIARNFPPAWVAPGSIETLPVKLQSLLQRLGKLERVPTTRQSPLGLEAVAIFENPLEAASAVEKLHGTDLRTPAEKKAVNDAPPKDSERFWLQPPSDTPARASAPAAKGVMGSAYSAVNPEASAAPRKRLKLNGVFLSPLPASWAESDVQQLASPYGTVCAIRMEKVGSKHQGACIDYQKEAAAAAALKGLDGLRCMDANLRCLMQEEEEPAKSTYQFEAYIDELHMPARPDIEPRLDNCELYLQGLPKAARSEEGVHSLLSKYGELEEILLIKGSLKAQSGKAYVRFQHHAQAANALTGLKGATGADDLQVKWSESERVLLGTAGPYGLDVLSRLLGPGGSRLQEICKQSGAVSVTLHCEEKEMALARNNPKGNSLGRYVRFTVKCEAQTQANECWALLAQQLRLAHEASVREVQGSLVVRGFAASWADKGLRFVFAPFGGLASLALEDEKLAEEGSEDTKVVRLAYVQLRNASAMSKAVSNLHRTKVGDGDLLEECEVRCHHWHQRGWSNNTFYVSIFIDQLMLTKRPQKIQPNPTDREVFVRNLPLADMKEEQVREYFDGFGHVEDLNLLHDDFSNELTGEAYVRFKSHEDARNCIEALPPDTEAEATDLAGSWSESERVLQRRKNCYGFGIIMDLVGADGSGLKVLAEQSKFQSLWLMSESLKLKDHTAPPRNGKQLHFVGRCHEEPHRQEFKELLERKFEEIHSRIAHRIEKKRRNAAAAAATLEAQAHAKVAAAETVEGMRGDPRTGNTVVRTHASQPVAPGPPPPAPPAGSPGGGWHVGGAGQWPAGLWREWPPQALQPTVHNGPYNSYRYPPNPASQPMAACSGGWGPGPGEAAVPAPVSEVAPAAAAHAVAHHEGEEHARSRSRHHRRRRHRHVHGHAKASGGDEHAVDKGQDAGGDHGEKSRYRRRHRSSSRKHGGHPSR